MQSSLCWVLEHSMDCLLRSACSLLPEHLPMLAAMRELHLCSGLHKSLNSAKL